MLARIILRSFSKQLRTYAVYALSILIAVTIFYSFGAMTFDQPILKSVKQDVQLSTFMTMGNFLVAFVVFVFMMTANYFFVQLRKPEVALYQLFGMRRRQIIGIFVFETLLVNLVSLVTGVITGLFTSKLFSMILIKSMNLNIESTFFISWISVRRTFFVFLLFLIPLTLQNMWLIRDKQLIANTHLSNSPKIQQHQGKWYQYFFGFLGIFFMLIGYYLSFHLMDLIHVYIQRTVDYSGILWIPLCIFFLIVLGTLFFFSHSLTSILMLLSKRKKWNDFSLNSFIFSNARFQIKQSWRALSFVTITIGLAIVILGVCAGLLTVSYRWNLLQNPTTFQLSSNRVDPVKSLIASAHGKVKEQQTVTFKLTGMYAQKKNKFVDRQFSGQTDLVNLISETEYKKIQRMLPNAPEIHLRNIGESVLFNQDFLISSKLSTYDRTVCLANQNLLVTNFYSDYFGNDLLRYTRNVLVVKDALFQSSEGISFPITYLNATGYDEATFQQKFETIIPLEWQNNLYYSIRFSQGQLESRIQTEAFPEAKNSMSSDTFSGFVSQLSHTSQFPSMRLERRKNGLFLFVAIFVGTILLISTVSTLIVRQFSRVEEEKQVYDLMKKIGVDKKSIQSSIYQQNFWLFFPVMTLSVSHGSMAVFILTRLIPSSNYWMVYLFALVVVFVFTLFYFLSSMFSIRMIEEDIRE